MKSLEHIIREIREGKGVKADKKSLEHSIRKVVTKEYESSYGAKDSKPVEETVGVVGTDKYQGTEFKSIRTATPHIKPPAGEGSHSQAPENASRQRNIAKERAGINRVEEQAVPMVRVPNIRLRPRLGEPARKLPEPEPAPIAPEKPNIPDKTPGKEPMPAPKPDNDPGPVKPSEKPTEKPSEKPIKTPGQQPEPSTKPSQKPSTAPEVAPAPQKAPAPETAPVPKTKTQPAPALAPEAQPAPLPQTAPALSTEPSPAPSPEPAQNKKGQEDDDLKRAGIPMAGVPHNFDYTISHLHRPNVSRGHAKSHRKHSMKEENERKEIENMPRKGDRKSIEYVGRKSADPKSTKEKTSRLATIKNVIDEARKAMTDKKIDTEDGKTKVYDYGDNVLIINPDQKRVNLDVEGNKIAKDYENK
jgi:hypothetical protein